MTLQVTTTFLATLVLSLLFCTARPVVAAIAASGDVLPYPSMGEVPEVVGRTSFGSVVVNEGSVVESVLLGIGTGELGIGTVDVVGNGSSWVVAESLELGLSGMGQLQVQEGGKITTAVLQAASSPLSSFGNASILVSGIGSELNVSDSLALGAHGDGWVSLVDGGRINAASGSVLLGRHGELFLDNGSLHAGQLEVAGKITGSGEVTVESGAVAMGVDATIEVGASGTLIMPVDLISEGVVELNEGELQLHHLENQRQGSVNLQQASLRLFEDGGSATMENRGLVSVWRGASDLHGSFRNIDGSVLHVHSDGVLTLHGQMENENASIGIDATSTIRVVDDLNLEGGKVQVEVLTQGTSLKSGRVEVLGVAALSGQLDVWDLVSSTFQLGDRFEILTAAGGITGNLTLQEMPVLDNGLVWKLKQTANTLSLSVGLPGDYNGDNRVNLADYVVWRNTLGSFGSFLAADESGPGGLADGVVDQWDYELWKENFGRSGAVASSANSSVPEPAAWLLVLAAGCSNCGILRRKR